METVLSSVPNALAMAVAQEATAIPEMLEDSAAQSEIEPIESASAASGESEDALDEESARLTDAALTG